jgi:hypothetical protein
VWLSRLSTAMCRLGVGVKGGNVSQVPTATYFKAEEGRISLGSSESVAPSVLGIKHCVVKTVVNITFRVEIVL